MKIFSAPEAPKKFSSARYHDLKSVLDTTFGIISDILPLLPNFDWGGGLPPNIENIGVAAQGHR